MKHLILALFVAVACASIISCTNKAPSPPEPENRVLETESAALEKSQAKNRRQLEKKADVVIEVEPVLPRYDPLEDHMISFSMVDTDLATILYLLADTVGMNLIMGKQVDENDRKVTLHFQNVSAKTVLNELARRFDLSYEIQDNIIKIEAFTERIYKLNFLDTHVETNFDIGGDVLGANDDQSTGLVGSVKLKGSGSKKGNAYDLLEEMVRNVKSDLGTFSINRLSGSLYVRDRPSAVNMITRLVNHFRDMMSRQILIEARIIEVSLSDGYEYGIDWDLLRSESDTTHRLNQAAWNLQSGLVLSGMNRSFNLETAIKTLQHFGDVKIVSNPTIRARHGSPAVISVGDSISYKKSVEVTTAQSTTTTTTDETVDIEVSTVFDGLILGVIPFIEETGNISLMINPVKSDVDAGSIENPEAVGRQESISLPRVGIKEINTTISMNSGDVVIIGGLINKVTHREDKGLPYISKVPLLGYLFKNEYHKQERKELVIILTVTVI